MKNTNKNWNQKLVRFGLGLGRPNLGLTNLRYILVLALFFLFSSSLIASAQTNQPPIVSITSPTNGASFTQGTNVKISVSASDPDGTIDAVTFFLNNSVAGVDDSAPYEYTISNVSLGNHSIAVQAIDNYGSTNAEEQNIQITVSAVVQSPTPVVSPGISPTPTNTGGGNTIPPTIPLTNPSGIETIPELLKTIITWLTIIMVPILTIMIVIGGFKMMTARDDEAQFTSGKKTVTYAAIGAAVVLVANGIALVIQSFLSGS